MPGTDSATYAGVVGVVVALALWTPVTGRALAQVVTLVHELGHALVGLAVGGRVQRLSLSLDASGETLALVGGRHPKARLTAFTVAGYPAPPLAGLLAAAAVASEDHRLLLLLSAVVVAAALVLWVRNLWGIVVFVATAAGLWLAATEAGDGVTRTVAIAAAWLFSLGGLRSAWQLTHGRAPSAAPLDDAERIAQLTRVLPRSLVVVGFVAVALVCLVGVVVLLVSPI